MQLKLLDIETATTLRDMAGKMGSLGTEKGTGGRKRPVVHNRNGKDGDPEREKKSEGDKETVVGPGATEIRERCSRNHVDNFE